MSGSSTPFDLVLELCRTQQRRIVLAALVDQSQSFTVDDLTKTITDHRDQTPLTADPDEVEPLIQLSLTHADLPKLVDAGVIEYDRARQLVEPTEQFGRLEPHLSAILEADPTLELPLRS